MTVAPGTRLGPYEILAPIGSGGMGEVFRAKDTRLDRSVAIKVLPSHLSSDARLRERFDREARAVSALNHPNICTLHDVGHHEGIDFIVMELLEGETLADRLAKGPLPLEQVLRYGAQIADGLDKAHRQGIVHRDLKPGNVMITKSGVKLLDFGLAKTLSATSAVSGLTNQPTEQKPLTQEGTILGTFQYMAPEQLEGEEADPRTDIFALGAVLYEMATGRRAFEGKTKTSLIAAIVGGEPRALRELQPLTPPGLEHVIDKCLEKEPDSRWQSAYDVAEELRWIASNRGSDSAASKPPRRALPWVVAAVAIIAAGVFGANWLRARSLPLSTIRFSIPPPKSFNFEEFSLSPDGRTIAFVADPDVGEERGLWIRPLDAAEPRMLPGVKQARKPFWSPDGRWIGYFTGGKLWKVPASGGSPQVICEAGYGVGAAWLDDGTILFTPAFNSSLHRVSAAGGEPALLTKLDRRRVETVHGYPVMIPGSRSFLFLKHTTGKESNELFLGYLDGIAARALNKADALAGYVEPDLLFVKDGKLFAQELDVDDARLRGEPRRIVDGVHYSEDGVVAAVSVRKDSLLYMSSSMPMLMLRWYDRTGKPMEVVATDTFFDDARLARDGKKLLYTRFDSAKGAEDVWVIDLLRGTRGKLTGGRSNNKLAVWSPDGQEIAFSSDRDGMFDIFVQPVDGSSAPRAIWKTDFDKEVRDWSPDGRYLLVWVYKAATSVDLWLVPRSGPDPPRPILEDEHDEWTGRFSPDGRWLAYVSDRSGVAEIYLRHLDSGKTEQVSIKGGLMAQWAADGSELFFITADKKMMAVAVKPSGQTVTIGVPKMLFAFDATQWTDFDLGPDGRFLIRSMANPDESNHLNVVVGWSSANNSSGDPE